MADRKNALLITLMDAVDSLEERLNKIDHIPEQINDIKEDFSTIKITLAKIEGQLSGTKINIDNNTRIDGNLTGNINQGNGKK